MRERTFLLLITVYIIIKIAVFETHNTSKIQVVVELILVLIVILLARRYIETTSQGGGPPCPRGREFHGGGLM